MLTETVELTKHIKVTNGGISNHIGYDKNFSPILYFKENKKFSALDALADYLAFNEMNAFMVISTYLNQTEQTRISDEIKRKYMLVAFDMVFNIDYPLPTSNGYTFTYLKKQSK